MGSPPLTRERLRTLPEPEEQFGDHPRLRGKDTWISNVYPEKAGSPPLTRERLL